MTDREKIEALERRLLAQDLILKAMLNMIMGLGMASGAWPKEMASDGVAKLAANLKASAAKADRGADAITLLAFVVFASESALQIAQGSDRGTQSRSGPKPS